MELAWLESFVALCEHQSFTRAAEAQHLSQPAFSRRIRSLERWAGTPLFDRSTYPVTLTTAGVDLRVEAVFILDALNDARARIRGVAGDADRPLRIATSHTLAVHFFPSWWASIVSSAGAMRVQVLPMDTLDAYDSLANGGSDVLLAHVDPDQPPLTGEGMLESTTLASDEFAPYSAVENGRAKFALPMAAGETVPMVSHGPAVFLGRLTDRVLGATRDRYVTIALTDLTAAIARMVEAGFGVGWLPATVTRDLEADGKVARLCGGMTARLDIRLHRRAGRTDGRLIETVWSAAQAAAKVER